MRECLRETVKSGAKAVIRQRVRVAATIFVSVFGLLLAGCAGDGPQVSPAVTNAPVGAGADVPEGSAEDFIVNVGRRIYFRENSSEIDDTARVTLDNQAEWLTRNARWKVKIQGFADDAGSAEQNKTVSTKRAENTRAYLASKGIAANRMTVKGYGRERLVRDCPDISCRSQNRRVITNLEGDGGV